MIIKIIGDQKKSRWSVQFDDKLITLNGCDYLALLSLAVVWINNKDNWLHKSLLFDDLTSRYIYRMCKHIEQLTGIKTKGMVQCQFYASRNKNAIFGNYRLNVDDVIIENPAYSFDDNRFNKVIKDLVLSNIP